MKNEKRNGKICQATIWHRLWIWPFKYKACDFCDDVFAETADVVVGDAWIPKYLTQGNSLVVTRSSLFDSLINKYTKRVISFQIE